jgi:hypothetical protein
MMTPLNPYRDLYMAKVEHLRLTIATTRLCVEEWQEVEADLVRMADLANQWPRGEFTVAA